jgi:hypothetical protein
MRDLRFKLYIGWNGRDSGVARVGSAKVAPAVSSLGYDRIGYPFTPSYSGLYDNITGPGLYSALGFTLTRGRSSRWENIVAGELGLSVHDKGDGRYNPNNPASVLYGKVLPMVPCKAVAVLEDNVTEEDLFHGWLDEEGTNPDVDTQLATFNFKDLLMLLADDNPIIAPTGPIYVGEVIGLILDWFDWKNPALRSLARGSLLPGFQAIGDKSGLDLIGEMLTVDLGLFFHSRKNVATYYDRYEYARRASIGNFQTSESQIPGVARKNIKNRIMVTYPPNAAQVIEDPDSRRQYGPKAWQPVSSEYFGSDANAASFGKYKIAQGKNPINTVWAFTVSEGPVGYFDKIVTADLIDRVTIENPALKDYHIERLVHRAEAGVLLKTDWTLSERAANLPALVGKAKVAPAINTPGYDRVTY